MKVSDAIKTRMTVRQFMDTPVPLETLRELLEIAKRAPSGGNLQPWTVHAITGEALKSLVRDVEEKMKAGVTEEPEYNVYPPDLIEPYRTRRRIVGQQLYDLIGVPQTLKEHLTLSDDEILFCGMALGYKDEDAVINELVSERETLENFVTLHGF